jgi:ABC-type polysaccharide/polyol phosphate transport system ATPase subunit
MTSFIAMFSVVVKNYKGLNDEVTDFAEQGDFSDLEINWYSAINYYAISIIIFSTGFRIS